MNKLLVGFFNQNIYIHINTKEYREALGVALSWMDPNILHIIERPFLLSSLAKSHGGNQNGLLPVPYRVEGTISSNYFNGMEKRFRNKTETGQSPSHFGGLVNSGSQLSAP